MSLEGLIIALVVGTIIYFIFKFITSSKSGGDSAIKDNNKITISCQDQPTKSLNVCY
jgi:hypothetical protein